MTWSQSTVKNGRTSPPGRTGVLPNTTSGFVARTRAEGASSDTSQFPENEVTTNSSKRSSRSCRSFRTIRMFAGSSNRCNSCSAMWMAVESRPRPGRASTPRVRVSAFAETATNKVARITEMTADRAAPPTWSSIAGIIFPGAAAVYKGSQNRRLRLRIFLVQPPLGDLGTCGHPNLGQRFGVTDRINDCLGSD